jgi:D-amino-acid oxidase
MRRGRIGMAVRNHVRNATRVSQSPRADWYGEAMQGSDVIVIGAGVSGLTTAICLAEAGSSVRVWATDPPQRTTSAVAGALWGPSFQEPAVKTLAWTAQSLQDFTELARDPETGVRLVTARIVGDLPTDAELPPQAALIPDLAPLHAARVPDGFSGGFRATMPLVDMPRYLHYLTRRLEAVGTRVENRTIQSLSEVVQVAPVVVNCTGLGARWLAGDETMRPVFGQHVVLTNPGVDELFLELSGAAEWTSIFPHPQRVVCGGISLPDRPDLTPDTDVAARILARCRRIEPRLEQAEVLETVTGLRPDRPAVRVEAVNLDGGRCVHNYGHGGSGVSLSWGCAREAAALSMA